MLQCCMEQLPQSFADGHTNKLAVDLEVGMSIWNSIEANGTNKYGTII